MVVIVLTSKITFYEIGNYWYSHSTDEETGAQRGWDFPRQVTSGGAKAPTQELRGVTPSPTASLSSSCSTLPFTHCLLVSLPSFLFLKHAKFFPAQGHETYCSVGLDHPSPLLAELTSCLS